MFEGDKYHSNQIKRKSFDFERNDSLHPYYINDNALTDGVFSFTWDATYPKPDSEKSYKWKSKVSLEDYTHVYFQDFKEGTNNVRKPWKMLDVSLSAKEIKLDRRFFETVRARLSEVPRDLQLTFVVGKDELTEDSVNQKTLDLLVQELRSFGNSLMNFSIQGTASPEGSQAMNIELARKRARKILNMVGSNIQSASLSIKEPKVYTWNDVAEYEVKDKTDNVIIASGEADTPATDEAGKKRVSLKLDTELSRGSEFVLKLRLINEDGRKFIFFTTVKFTKGDKFTENYNFVKKFFEATLSKTDEKAIKPYLETNGSMDNMSFNYVNIHSSYDVVTWGKISLEHLTAPVITVTENSENTSGIVYKYIAKTAGEVPNYYFVKEYYRVNRIENATYLLAFERRVEEIYNPEKTSVSKSQLKLGITANTGNDCKLDKENKYLAFSRERDLWYYETKENKMLRIFSFLGEDFSDERTYYDNHSIKVLRIEDSGDLYFIVYGYMNRGVYEGKTGIILYKYLRGDDRIEEQAYIPVNLPAQFFKGDLSDFSFVSTENFFYFSLYDKIYSYSLIKRKLSVMADNVSGDSYLALSENNHIVWQETPDVTKVKKLIVMDLETRKTTEIEAEKKTVLRLLLRDRKSVV